MTSEANPPPATGKSGPPASAPRGAESAAARWLGLSAGEWSVVVLLAVAFAPAVVAMSRVWSSVDYQSHGYLVPFVALWAASGKRRSLARIPAARDLRGLALLGVAFGLYLVGFASSWVALQGLSLVAGVAGGVLYLRGAAWLRVLVFPVGYLLFMVPIPEPVLTPVVVKLQLLVSQAGVWLLQLGGVPVLRNGNVIELPGDVSLFVAEACSGITSLVTLLPLAVFLAYFTEKTLARRLVLIAAVLPLALGGNLIRVIGTVLAAREIGVEAATAGAGHEAAGLVAYVLACLALLAIGRLMRMLVPPQPEGVGSA